MTFHRFALYYVPPPDPAWVRFATSWLGWDVVTGNAVDHPAVAGLSLPVAPLTETPRKYGLHGTLKPPFRLAQGYNRDDLETACAGLAATLAPVRLGDLTITALGRFLALCPSGSPALGALAADCVREIDRFRASPDAVESARRCKATLSERQVQNLMNWGYPHVLEDFRFHITLTGRLSKPDVVLVRAALEQALTPLLPNDLMLSELALVGEDDQGRFHLLRRFRLSDQEQ